MAASNGTTGWTNSQLCNKEDNMCLSAQVYVYKWSHMALQQFPLGPLLYRIRGEGEKGGGGVCVVEQGQGSLA